MILSTLLGRRGDSSWFPTGANAVGGGPSSNFWYSLLMRQTKSGVDVNEQTALTYAAVWCATLRRSGTMGQLPKNLYRRTENGLREIAQDRDEHWLVHREPNPEMTASRYHGLMEEWRVNGGNGVAEIQWDVALRSGARSPVAFHPIHPSRVKFVRNTNGDLFCEVRNDDAEPSYISYADVIHLPSLILRDTVTGIGIVENARESIGLGIATEQHGADMLGAGGVPVIALEQDVAVIKDQAQREAFRKEWKEIHGSGENNVAILPPGMKVKQLTLSMEDLQFLTLRQHNVEEIARWYDLPPHMLHHLLRMTNNNIEHQGIEAVQYSFLPWIVPAEQEYLRKLFPDRMERRQYYYKWEVNGLLRGDSQSRSAFYHSAIVDGWLSPNEVRELEDWNPYEGGDTYFIQGAMVPVRAAANPPDETAVVPQRVEQDNEDEEDDDSAELRRAVSELTATRAKLRDAARGMLSATLARMVHIETTAARRASKKPEGFMQWLDDFYGEHEQTMATALRPVLSAASAFGMGDEPERWSAALCDQSRQRLLTLAGEATATNLAEKVGALMDEWEQDRAACIVRGIAELN